MLARWLPLLLALCTLVPAHVLARFALACQEPDGCCCRRGDEERAPHGPAFERVDCCEAPGSTEIAATPAIATPRSAMPVVLADAIDSAAILGVPPEGQAAAPRAKTRGPPARVHALVERWLV